MPKISLDLETGLEADLNFYAELMDKKPNDVIREAITMYLEVYSHSEEFVGRVHQQFNKTPTPLRDPYEKED